MKIPIATILLLFFSYWLIALDGQIFTQKIEGIAICLVCYGLLIFRLKRKKKKKTPELGLLWLLIMARTFVLWQRIDNLGYAYEYQKNFNEQLNESKNNQ